MHAQWSFYTDSWTLYMSNGHHILTLVHHTYPMAIIYRPLASTQAKWPSYANPGTSYTTPSTTYTPHGHHIQPFWQRGCSSIVWSVEGGGGDPCNDHFRSQGGEGGTTNDDLITWSLHKGGGGFFVFTRSVTGYQFGRYKQVAYWQDLIWTYEIILVFENSQNYWYM